MLGIESQLRIERLRERDPSDLNVSKINILLSRIYGFVPSRSEGEK